MLYLPTHIGRPMNDEDDLDDNEKENEQKKYSLTFSLDREKFFRRECPSCGRHYKTLVDEADLASSIQPTFRELGLEIGAQADNNDSESALPSFYCPYCEHKVSSDQTLTQQFSEYLKLWIFLEYIQPAWDNALSDLSNDPTSNSSGKFFSISLSYTKGVKDPRPISGPEAPDMKKVDLLCCEKSIKILDSWNSVISCTYCGRRAALQ
jgi:DNA-directed RNA polymerase subunit RPC12/RpoP